MNQDIKGTFEKIFSLKNRKIEFINVEEFEKLKIYLENGNIWGVFLRRLKENWSHIGVGAIVKIQIFRRLKYGDFRQCM